jgi:hypothetical protein
MRFLVVLTLILSMLGIVVFVIDVYNDATGRGNVGVSSVVYLVACVVFVLLSLRALWTSPYPERR